MIFLIEYNRREGCLVTLTRFDESQRDGANARRLALELDLNRKRINHEAVLLEARDENALQMTHGRSFKSVEKILQSMIAALESKS
jgi:hypothetical protein